MISVRLNSLHPEHLLSLERCSAPETRLIAWHESDGKWSSSHVSPLYDICAATHSTVPFPQEAYLKRIQRLAADCHTRVCTGLPSNYSPAEAAAAVQDFLQHSQKFTVTPYGRSNLPHGSVVDHRVTRLLLLLACYTLSPQERACSPNSLLKCTYKRLNEIAICPHQTRAETCIAFK
jgi:hypothetical protein